MKQLSQNLRTGKLSVDDVPSPAVQPGQVLVHAAYSLISAGTERTKIETGRKSLIGKALARPDQVRQVLNSFKQLGFKSTYEKVMTRLDARSPLGYSASGVVLAVGAGIDEFRPGDRVACGGAGAAHAEMVSVPKNLCVKAPEGIQLDTAAFATVGAIAMQGLRQADLRLGEVAVVLGLGLLGQMSAQLLKAAGCAVVGFDPDISRCKLALELGADAASATEAALIADLERWSAGRGADAVLITAGTSSNRPVELAGELCRDKGRVVVVGAVGLTIPREPYYLKELDLRLSRSYGPGRYDPAYEEKGQDYPYGYIRWTEKRNMEAFLALAAQGKVILASLITHRFKLEQAEEAYAVISGRTDQPYLGVLFEYPAQPETLPTRVEGTARRVEEAGPVGVGVIGAGNFAQSMLLPHLKSHPQASLRSVVTLTPLATRDVAERFGFAQAVSTPDEILADPAIRAVLIATRHDSHAELAIQALRAGKAIHLEKPLALNEEQLEEVITAYNSSSSFNPQSSSFILHPSSFLMVGFNRRFAPLVQELSGFLSGRREPLAMIYRINAGYLPLDHWTQDAEQGGGRVIGEVCHFIDLLQFLAETRPMRVYSTALPNQGKYRDDNIAINLTFEDGSVGVVLYVANGDRALPKEYLEVSCAGKSGALTDFRSLALMSGGRARTVRSRQDKGHRAEVLAWVEAIRAGQPEPVPFEQAVWATRATFAALQSLEEGRAINLA